VTQDQPAVAHERRDLAKAWSPPASGAGFIGWSRRNLFGSWFNTLLTLLCLYLIWLVVLPATKFLLVDAVWSGAGRNDCLAKAGAC